MLQGPIELEYLDKIVRQPLPGIYVLSKTGDDVDYVGRSDTNLPAGIKEAVKAGKGYRYFGYEYLKSAMEAYNRECESYHKYNPNDNSNHPIPPAGSDLTCPVAGCKQK